LRQPYDCTQISTTPSLTDFSRYRNRLGSEKELSARFGVGRWVMREALRSTAQSNTTGSSPQTSRDGSGRSSGGASLRIKPGAEKNAPTPAEGHLRGFRSKQLDFFAGTVSA